MKSLIGTAIGAAALVLSLGSLANAQTPLNNFRIEGGVGYDIGNADLNTTTNIGGTPVTLKANLIGSGGFAANAALWYDGAFGPPGTFPGDISIGLQYLHFSNDGTLSESGGGVSASATLSRGTNAAMADVEWRPRDGRFHPFVGAGLGAAFTSINISAGIGGIGGIGGGGGSLPTDNEVSFAAQGFFGFDYDFTSNLYGGVTGTFFYTDADYTKLIPGVKLNIAYQELAVMAHLGWKF